MTMHKVAELTDDLLDEAVARADGLHYDRKSRFVWIPPGKVSHEAITEDYFPYEPSTQWVIAGPIIERERIRVVQHDDGRWIGHHPTQTWKTGLWYGPTQLVAGMRAYVASRFGETVELP